MSADRGELNEGEVANKTHREAAWLPQVRFHDLRYTVAVPMFDSGVPINVVSQDLGYKDHAMNRRRHAHVLSDGQQMAADRIDNYGY